MGNEEKLNADSTWLINEMNQNWDSFVMFGVNSIDTFKKKSFLYAQRCNMAHMMHTWKFHIKCRQGHKIRVAIQLQQERKQVEKTKGTE